MSFDHPITTADEIDAAAADVDVTTAVGMLQAVNRLSDDEYFQFCELFARLHAEDGRAEEREAFRVRLQEFVAHWRKTHRRRDPRTLERAEEIKRLRQDGWIWQQINEHFHKSDRWAQNLLRDLGLWPVNG